MHVENINFISEEIEHLEKLSNEGREEGYSQLADDLDLIISNIRKCLEDERKNERNLTGE